MRDEFFKTKTHKGYSGDTFSVNYIEHRITETGNDTEVKIISKGEEQILFWISSNDIAKFDEELTNLINKYRI